MVFLPREYDLCYTSPKSASVDQFLIKERNLSLLKANHKKIIKLLAPCYLCSIIQSTAVVMPVFIDNVTAITRTWRLAER